MAFLATISNCLHRVDRKILKLVETGILSITDALNHITSYGPKSSPGKVILALFEVRDSDSAREHGSCGHFNSKVGQTGAKHPVGHVDAHETVVDEQIAAHHFVDHQLFDEGESAIVREHAACFLRLVLLDEPGQRLVVLVRRCHSLDGGAAWAVAATRAMATLGAAGALRPSWFVAESSGGNRC